MDRWWALVWSTLVAVAVLLSPALPAGAAAASEASGWSWPLLGEVITPYKNGNDPYAAGQHRGIDIAAPVGTPVHAIVDGRVSFSGTLPDGGLTVTVRSADDRHLVSSLHLASRAVTRGDAVRAGSLIGAVGMTGKRSATQPHLHLSVRLAATGAYVDPLPLLGTQRVLEEPKAVVPSAEPAAAQPLEVDAPAAGRPAATKHIVHAQTHGDVAADKVAIPRGSSRPTRAASAREGHAAAGARVGRVAPPPIPVAEPRVENATAPMQAAPATSQATATPATQVGGSNTRRILLLAVALVCIAAMFLRRRPEPATDHGPATNTPAKPGEVVPLRRVS